MLHIGFGTLFYCRLLLFRYCYCEGYSNSPYNEILCWAIWISSCYQYWRGFRGYLGSRSPWNRYRWLCICSCGRTYHRYVIFEIALPGLYQPDFTVRMLIAIPGPIAGGAIVQSYLRWRWTEYVCCSYPKFS